VTVLRPEVRGGEVRGGEVRGGREVCVWRICDSTVRLHYRVAFSLALGRARG
jgi:hypothetical protein